MAETIDSLLQLYSSHFVSDRVLSPLAAGLTEDCQMVQIEKALPFYIDAAEEHWLVAVELESYSREMAEWEVQSAMPSIPIDGED
jgi:hypothetical protein